MRKMAALICLLLALCMGAAAEAEGQTRIMLATDIHYLSPAQWQGSAFFLEALAQGNGMSAMYSRELLDGFLAEVRHQRPDVLVLTGDLTFNGARQSHEELAAALRPLMDEGIRVAVIPGNHDIKNFAVRYLEDTYEQIENVDAAAFREIWQDFLAEEMPGPGFSGLVRASDSAWVALGDYSIYEVGTASNGLCKKAHLAWLEELLAAADEAGAQVISASHQSLVPHTNNDVDSYCVWFGEQAVAILAKAGCALNVSGHIHIQSISSDAGMTDICTGAWSMSPHRYAMVTVDEDGSIHYRASTVCPEHVAEGVLEDSRRFYREVHARTRAASLERLKLDEETVQAMVEFALDVNEAWFGGTLAQRKDLLEHPAYELWKIYSPRANVVRQLTQLAEDSVPNVTAWDLEK